MVFEKKSIVMSIYYPYLALQLAAIIILFVLAFTTLAALFFILLLTITLGFVHYCCPELVDLCYNCER